MIKTIPKKKKCKKAKRLSDEALHLMYACKDMQARALLETRGPKQRMGSHGRSSSKPGWGSGRLGNKQEEELQCPRRE